MTIFYLHSYCKRIVNIVPVYKQVFHLLPASRHSCTYMCKLCVKSHSHKSIDCLDREFLLKLRTDHLGKFIPREINPLYGIAMIHDYSGSEIEPHYVRLCKICSKSTLDINYLFYCTATFVIPQ